MARLPSERYLIQQIDGTVVLFEDFTERAITYFDPADGTSVAAALEIIRGCELGDEDKCFACFWAGYFHAYANRDPELPRELFITQQGDTGPVVVTAAGAEVVRFDPADGNAAARAQKAIYDSALSPHDKDRAHFWSGFAHAHGYMPGPG
jgi:hypothetical protein